MTELKSISDRIKSRLQAKIALEEALGQTYDSGLSQSSGYAAFSGPTTAGNTINSIVKGLTPDSTWKPNTNKVAPFQKYTKTSEYERYLIKKMYASPNLKSARLAVFEIGILTKVSVSPTPTTEAHTLGGTFLTEARTAPDLTVHQGLNNQNLLFADESYSVFLLSTSDPNIAFSYKSVGTFDDLAVKKSISSEGAEILSILYDTIWQPVYEKTRTELTEIFPEFFKLSTLSVEERAELSTKNPEKFFKSSYVDTYLRAQEATERQTAPEYLTTSFNVGALAMLNVHIDHNSGLVLDNLVSSAQPTVVTEAPIELLQAECDRNNIPLDITVPPDILEKVKAKLQFLRSDTPKSIGAGLVPSGFARDMRKYIRSRERMAQKVFTTMATTLAFMTKPLMKFLNLEVNVVSEVSESGTAQTTIYSTLGYGQEGSRLKQYRKFRPMTASYSGEHAIVYSQRLTEDSDLVFNIKVVASKIKNNLSTTTGDSSKSSSKTIAYPRALHELVLSSARAAAGNKGTTLSVTKEQYLAALNNELAITAHAMSAPGAHTLLRSAVDSLYDEKTNMFKSGILFVGIPGIFFNELLRPTISKLEVALNVDTTIPVPAVTEIYSSNVPLAKAIIPGDSGNLPITLNHSAIDSLLTSVDIGTSLHNRNPLAPGPETPLTPDVAAKIFYDSVTTKQQLLDPATQKPVMKSVEFVPIANVLDDILKEGYSADGSDESVLFHTQRMTERLSALETALKTGWWSLIGTDFGIGGFNLLSGHNFSLLKPTTATGTDFNLDELRNQRNLALEAARDANSQKV